MENKTFFLMIGLALATGMPYPAFAYLTPDQVFGGANLNQQSPPPTPRDAPTVVEQQQERSAVQRSDAQSSLTPSEPQDRYTAPSEPRNLFNNETQYEIRQQRIEEKKSSGPTIVIGGGATVLDANGNVLHSGAPRVSSTGPESILAAMAMILAGICTFVLVHVRSHKKIIPESVYP